ncbi:MAG: GNAT family N-acetyltransferase [Microthrixaceae bacterium]
MVLTRETITVGSQRFRVTPWHAQPGVAQLSMPPRQAAPPTEAIRVVLDTLAGRGCTRVITAAMSESETTAFDALGFVEDDRLHVLEYDLDRPRGDRPGRSREVRVKRPARADRAGALDLDAAAFDPFWRLDSHGLADAEHATPHSRFRVASVEGDLAGYAITGRGGGSGFLQRLATRPDMQRRGVATTLVRDSLRWCERHGCRQVYVNTQVINSAALALYRSIGFERTQHDLVVLSWSADA